MYFSDSNSPNSQSASWPSRCIFATTSSMLTGVFSDALRALGSFVLTHTTVKRT